LCSTVVSVAYFGEKSSLKKIEESDVAMKLKSYSVVLFVLVIAGSMSLQSVEKTKIKKFSKKEPVSSLKPRALVNVGNTCYLNSLVQNLYNMPGLVNVFSQTNFRTIAETREQTIAEGWKKDLPKQKSLANAMQAVFIDLKKGATGDTTPALTGLLNAFVGMGVTTAGAQEDVAEPFSLGFFNNFVTEDIFNKLFQFTTQTQYRGPKSKEQLTKEYASTWMFATSLERILSVPYSPELGEALYFYRDEEGNSITKAQKEDREKKKQGYVQQGFTSLPLVLAVQLKRAVWDPDLKKVKKISEPCIVPDKLTLQTLKNDDKADYQLIGAAVQLGGEAGSGHYVAYVLNQWALGTKQAPQWFYCSDEYIEVKSKKEALAEIQSGVLFFYKRLFFDKGTDKSWQDIEKILKTGTTSTLKLPEPLKTVMPPEIVRSECEKIFVQYGDVKLYYLDALMQSMSNLPDWKKSGVGLSCEKLPQTARPSLGKITEFLPIFLRTFGGEELSKVAEAAAESKFSFTVDNYFLFLKNWTDPQTIMEALGDYFSDKKVAEKLPRWLVLVLERFGRFSVEVSKNVFKEKMVVNTRTVDPTEHITLSPFVTDELKKNLPQEGAWYTLRGAVVYESHKGFYSYIFIPGQAIDSPTICYELTSSVRQVSEGEAYSVTKRAGIFYFYQHEGSETEGLFTDFVRGLSRIF